MSTFRHDGIDFNFEMSGEGQVVVFNHGLTGDLSQPLDLVGPLDGYRLLVWDCRGHGKTEPVGPKENLNFQTFAHDLYALLNHLEISKAVIGGISMGAGTAVHFAVRWPELVEALVLVRPAWLDKADPPNLRHCRLIAKLLDRLAASPEFKYEDALVEHPDVADLLRVEMAKPRAVHRRARLEQIPLSSPIQDLTEVRRLTMPALVLGARHDAAHPYEYAETWCSWLPFAELAEIPSKEGGFEKYRDQFRAAFTRFLAGLR